MELNEAIAIAMKVGKLLEPVCDELIVAGSIRRNCDDVGDIELVVAPRMIAGPKTNWTGELISALDPHVDRLVAGGGPLAYDEETRRNGPRHKRLIWDGAIVVEIYAVRPPASFGAILAIRTGPADFSRLLVTKESLGGAMPEGLQQRDGALWSGRSGRLDTPTEEDWFAALGVPRWPPPERTAAKLTLFLNRERRRKDAGLVTEADRSHSHRS